MQHCKRRDGDQQRTNNLSLVHKPVKRGNSGCVMLDVCVMFKITL
jgi:hypothetical protein